MKKILLGSLFFCCLNFVHAQSGFPDPTFGTRGTVKTDMGSLFNYGTSGKQVLTSQDGSIYVVLDGALITKRLANGSIDSSYGVNGYSTFVKFYDTYATLQTDGKILIAGGDNTNPNGFDIARLNTNGTPDSSFGTNGIMGVALVPKGVAVQSNGKIIIAGNLVDSFAVIRLNANGSLDNTFNLTGLAVSSLENFALLATSVAVQADGKIVVGGSAFSQDVYSFNFALARYNQNGSLDNSFGSGGIQTTQIGESARGYSLALQTDQKIILAGYAFEGTPDAHFAVARYTTDGNLDPSFNTIGIQTAVISSDGLAGNSVALQSNGKIIVAGYTMSGSMNDFAVARFNADGSADNTFGTAGILSTDISTSDDYAISVAVQSDNKVLVAGYSTINGGSVLVVTRYNDNGGLDNSFGTAGKLKGDYKQGSTSFNITAVQADKKIIAAGRTWNGTNNDFAIVRYNTNGSLDNSFSADGKQTADFGSTDEAFGIAVQTNGKIVIAGNSNSQFALARFNADGTPDLTFNGTGKFTFSMGSSDVLKSVALQADGKIVVGGFTYTDTNFDSAFFAVARINTNGTLDNTFSGDGKQLTDFDDAPSFGNSLTIQSNGKIVVAGTSVANAQNRFAVVRYNTDGSLDNTFSGDGKQTSIFGADNYFPQSVALQNDGKIVVAGYSETYSGSSSSFAVARYLANGDLDNSFNDDGFTTTNLGTDFDFGLSLAITSNGEIAVGGTNDNFAIVLYKANGTRDSTFGVNGIRITKVGVGNSRIQSLVFFENKLYAAGGGQFPGTFGVLVRYMFAEGGPLPVSLVDLKAILQNNKTTLVQWQTESEQNLAGFIVERSGDGSSFTTIGYVAATGNSGVKTNYSLTDIQPLHGVNFYRLKMVDKDGRNGQSKVASVILTSDAFTLKLSPIPARNILFVQATGQNEKATFRIIDAGGRAVKEVIVTLTENSQLSLDINALPNGVYTLQLNSTTKTETKRFIKE